LEKPDHHVRQLKVVDPNKEEVVTAYAKWEIYPNGRLGLEKLHQPLDQADGKIDQDGDLREEYFSAKPRLTTTITIDEVLALLATNSRYRRRGAGSLLVEWGIKLSNETGLPCYLQTSEQGRRLYRHYGLRDIDTVQFNLEDHGLDGVERMTEMSREPDG
jgi:GNAT superfamily N-acetyltransferase